MILILLTMTIALDQPIQSQDESFQMNPKIARQRITQIIQGDTTLSDPQETLTEIIQRCGDLEVVSLAHYTLGTTQLNQPNLQPKLIQRSITAFEQADTASNDPAIRSQSRFNIGHAYYLLAHLPPENDTLENQIDIQSMIDSLKEKNVILRASAGAFRSVIEIKPTDSDAIGNVERVRMEIQSLNDQIKSLEDLLEQQQQQEQEQQQKQQQEQQDAADKLDELAQQQQQQADQSSSNPPEDSAEQEKQRNDQSELSDETETTRQDIANQESKQDLTEQIEKKIQEAQQAQSRAQEAMEEGDQPRAAQAQQNAADALKEAAQAMQELADQSKEQSEGKGENGESQEPSDTDQSAQQPNENEEKGDQISEIAKQLLDKERRERDARQAYRAVSRPTKVEKDW